MNKKICKNCGAIIEQDEKICSFCGNNVESDANDLYNSVQGKKEISETENTLFIHDEDYILKVMELADSAMQVKLGIMYSEGITVKQNTSIAVALFEKAAYRGNREGMFKYAEALQKGLGIKQNREKAFYSYTQAAKAGHTIAKHVLKELTAIKKGETEPTSFHIYLNEDESEFEKTVSNVKKFCVEITCYENGVPKIQGSGCVISDGVVLTNAHVVLKPDEEGLVPYSEIEAKVYDGDRVFKLVPKKINKTEDIAICVIKEGNCSFDGNYPYIAEDYEYILGQEVFTIGNGLGKGLALSKGVLSRCVEKDLNGCRDIIRTDISVHQGNSGGPLFDKNGIIIGMMTYAYNGCDYKIAHGMSCAVISESIIKVINE